MIAAPIATEAALLKCQIFHETCACLSNERDRVSPARACCAAETKIGERNPPPTNSTPSICWVVTSIKQLTFYNPEP